MLLGIQLLNPASISHRRRLQCYPSHQFHSDFRQWASFLGIQLFWLPHSGFPASILFLLANSMLSPSGQRVGRPVCSLEASKQNNHKETSGSGHLQATWPIGRTNSSFSAACRWGRKVEAQRRWWKTLCLHEDECRTRGATQRKGVGNIGPTFKCGILSIKRGDSLECWFALSS